MGPQLDLPEVARHACRRRGHEDQVGPAQRQQPRVLREVPVVADHDPDRDPEGRGVGGKPGVARPEVVLLVARQVLGDHQGNRTLARPPQQVAVGAEHGGGVVELALDHPLVDGRDQHDPLVLGQPGHGLDGRPGDGLRQLVIPGVLLVAEVGGVEQLLEADDAGPLGGGLLDVAPGLLDVLLLVRTSLELDQGGLDQAAGGLRPAAGLRGAGALRHPGGGFAVARLPVLHRHAASPFCPVLQTAVQPPSM